MIIHSLDHVHIWIWISISNFLHFPNVALIWTDADKCVAVCLGCIPSTQLFEIFSWGEFTFSCRKVAYCSYVLVFSKNPTLHVYWFCNVCTPYMFIPTSIEFPLHTLDSGIDVPPWIRSPPPKNFNFVFNWGGMKPWRSPNKGVRPSPFMLAWVTNVSTSPDLYIEFSTEY